MSNDVHRFSSGNLWIFVLKKTSMDLGLLLWQLSFTVVHRFQVKIQAMEIGLKFCLEKDRCETCLLKSWVAYDFLGLGMEGYMRYVFPLSALISGKNPGLEISLKLSWKRQFILKVRFRQRFQAWKIGLKICLEKDRLSLKSNFWVL